MGGSDKFAPFNFSLFNNLSMDFRLFRDALVRGEAWLKREVSIGVTRLFNKLPIRGVLIQTKYILKE